MRVRILVVDDNMTNEIADMIVGHFRVESAPVDFEAIDDFNRVADIQENPYEIAIFDYRDETKKESSGHAYAQTYKKSHADSLVILKSTHRATFTDAQDARAIKFAVDNLHGGPTWDKNLRDHITTWLKRGGTAALVRGQYAVVEGTLRLEDAERIAGAAQYLVNEQWFEEASDGAERARQIHVLACVGANLKQTALRQNPPPGKRPYLHTKVEKGGPWVPWEFLLFEGSYDLAMPISYVVPRPAGKPNRSWELRKVLYVSLDGLDTKAELAAIKETLSWAELGIDEVSYKDFVSGKKHYPVDVVHIAMHGPGDPEEQFSLAKLSPLLRAISRTKPSLLVLNACHGIHMLLDKQRTPYPFPVTHLQQMFDDVDTIVTAQYPLENVAMPPIWSKAFYQALALTGDAAIAAGWARRVVAEGLQQFYELSTVVISRTGSPLAITGDP